MTRRDRPLRRTYGNRPERQRFLIYCEGEVTEKTYFKGIRKELRRGNIQVVIGPNHSDPLKLVKAAIKHQRDAPTRHEDGYEAYDQVWCVFDVEAPRPHPTLDAARHHAAKHGVHTAISNPCFEIWLLLHFDGQGGYTTSDQASQRLEACDCGYDHRAKKVDYDLIRGRRLAALDRARRLHEKYPEATAIQARNPWTSVPDLVEELFRAA